MNQSIEFTRINNDVNGNPRYVCHFHEFTNDADRKQALAEQKAGLCVSFVDSMYKTALRRAKHLGGRKFHNKQYGGGIVFQSYNITQLEQQINEIREKYTPAVK